MRTVAINNTDEVTFQSETAEEDCLRTCGRVSREYAVLRGILKLHGELERWLSR